jgi:hypothetical protein
MKALRVTVLAVAALTTTSLACGTAVSAWASPHAGIIGRATGNGATLAAAEQDALTLLSELFTGCTAPFTFYSYAERSNGTWWADVEANCKSVY